MSFNEEIEEQEIPQNAIIPKIVTLDGRNYVEIPLYGGKTYLMGSPDKRVIDLFKKAKYPYNDGSQDRNWQQFCNAIKRRKVYALVKQVNRTMGLSQGKVQDIYTVFIAIHGWDNKDGHREEARMIGVWKQPKFAKERNTETEELDTKGVDWSTRVFEFALDINNEDSVKSIDYYVEHCDPYLQLNVAPSPDSIRSESCIHDPAGFARGTYSELMQMAQNHVDLDTIRANKAYYQSLKPSGQAAKGGK